MKTQTTIESMVRPYLSERWKNVSSITDRKIISELCVSADDYNELIEDITDRFKIVSSEDLYERAGVNIIDRIWRRFHPRFYLAPPDLSIDELSAIVGRGAWPDEYLVPMKSYARVR